MHSTRVVIYRNKIFQLTAKRAAAMARSAENHLLPEADISFPNQKLSCGQLGRDGEEVNPLAAALAGGNSQNGAWISRAETYREN